MPQVYKINPDGSTIPMTKVYCANETRELQDLLAKNLDLLPGDQINPEEPRRWVLVQREMGVPDPGSGKERWAIDFVLLDQDAIPTFVECKRFADTRARREVVGQMLEYAANGHHYWDRDHFQQLAEQSARARGMTLEEALQQAQVDINDEADVKDFFARAEENLRQGHIRLVFFLEEAPFELKSIVDFLNKQMERTEVLLVEARQYELEGTRVVVPTLFGYTEEARRVKRAAPVAAGRRAWDEESFFEKVAADLGDDVFEHIYGLYTEMRAHGFQIRWGTGSQTGSFNVVVPQISPRSVFTVRTDGRLILNFGWLEDTEVGHRFGEALGRAVMEQFGWRLPKEYTTKYPSVPLEQWLPRAQEFADLVVRLVEEFEERTAP